MWVAKIGGSLAGNDALPGWLAALSADRARRWLLVPGGGPYADAVRAAQRRDGFSDAEAHARAMRAMARYADDLSALDPSLTICPSLDACAQTDAGWPRLWRPAAADVGALAALPADWRVTSDSLAFALAAKLHGAGLVLLKSAAPLAVPTSVEAAAAAGFVDEWLPTLTAGAGLPVFWANAAQPPPIPLGEKGWPSASQRMQVR